MFSCGIPCRDGWHGTCDQNNRAGRRVATACLWKSCPAKCVAPAFETSRARGLFWRLARANLYRRLGQDRHLPSVPLPARCALSIAALSVSYGDTFPSIASRSARDAGRRWRVPRTSNSYAFTDPSPAGRILLSRKADWNTESRFFLFNDPSTGPFKSPSDRTQSYASECEGGSPS
jgi:hypothetical protein